MLPCSFHLEGRCNFDREWCKYSHGNAVDVEDLKEFKEPNYNYLQMGMPCLVRYDDDLWYRAKVVDILEDHKFTVNFDNYNDTRTVDLEEILPLDASNNESDENSDDDDYADRNQPIDRGPEEEGEELPVYLWKPPKTNEALGSWEAHTRIGFDYTEQKTYWDFQEEVFVNLLGLSEPDRPIIIHVKGVEGDVLGSSVHKKCFTKLKEKCPKQQKIQLHSFSGTAEDVGMWTTEFPNCYFGFTWNVEFFNEIQKSAIRSVPRDKFLIETGILDQSVSLPRTAIKRPTQLGDLASLIAEIRGEKFDEFLKQTVENGQRLHGTRIVKKKSR
ncbi:hypothetical protein FSP39_012633 [Pinctada imbricata]|uniref:C3H1-type domain-containing protein n=1 Tax=Pinctada imbricata TaxID=66713 RepID=A0AA88XUG3_PINIB|nr:hypothetical protein FSP39_012633 [Pinctada imbricata]